MMNKGTYINFDGKKTEYTYDNTLTLSQKANFVMEVAGMVVSSTIGYAYILKEAIFNYCLIKYFTDIVLFENEDDFNLDMIDSFCKNNKESVIDVVTKAMGKESLDELIKACDEAIEFRKSHFSDYREEVSDLLQVVREFVVKPDYLGEFLTALTNFLNNASERDIDFDAVSKLSDIIPVLKNMGSVEVAKAIVSSTHKESMDDSKVVEMKKKTNRTKKETDTTKGN